jgi:hypothetical protein
MFMKTQSKSVCITLTSILLLSLTSLPIQSISILAGGVPMTQNTGIPTGYRLLSSGPEQADQQVALSYPPDPSVDIPWSAGTSSVADVQTAFNNARTNENNQLGTSIPMLILPSQTEWNSMSDGQKALWLINQERIDRGVAPLHGLETNVGSVAQYYADYLLDNNAWGHTADGRDPWKRLSDNPAIGACQDFLSVSENLAVFVTSGSSIPLPIERSIYMWMYEDGDCCNWGHRHAILWYSYNDNSGPAGREGFLGIGRANGGPYQGPFTQSWPFAEIIVMNVFDPCATWAYVEAPAAATLVSPSGSISDTTPTYTWNKVSDATNYLFWLGRLNSDNSITPILEQAFASSAVCGASTCSITPGVTLSGGNFRWWIRTLNSIGYGPWSIKMDFSLPTILLPGKAALISPSGSISDTTPSYTWNKVSASTWYYMWVSKVNTDGSLTTIHTKWYEGSSVCGASTCSITPAGVTLADGNYRWWIQSWNEGGYGSWSSPLNFSLQGIPAPGAATLVSPSGGTTNTTPTYNWNKMNSSTWYYLWVSRVNGNGSLTTVHAKWYDTALVCSAATCSITPAGITLSGGNYRWWIQTWNEGGYGPWSSSKDFTVSP